MLLTTELKRKRDKANRATNLDGEQANVMAFVRDDHRQLRLVRPAIGLIERLANRRHLELQHLQPHPRILPLSPVHCKIANLPSRTKTDHRELPVGNAATIDDHVIGQHATRFLEGRRESFDDRRQHDDVLQTRSPRIRN